MSTQYLNQRKQIVDQVITGLDLTEKSHLISFEKIQRLVFEAMESSKSTLQNEKPQHLEVISNNLQSLEDYLLPQFQVLVANCKFGKKYLNIRQRLNIEKIRNINYTDEEYTNDLDNLKQIGNKYKKEIDEICFEETLKLFGYALNNTEYKELLSTGAGTPDGYHLRKYIREKGEGESNPEFDHFLKEVEKFIQQQFQNELILQSKEAAKTTFDAFFKTIQTNQEPDMSRLTKNIVRGGIYSVENYKYESLIQQIVNQVTLFVQSYLSGETRMMNDETFNTQCMLGAVEKFLNEKKSIYQVGYIQEAIRKDMNSLLPKSLEKSIETLMNGLQQSAVDHIKTLKILARETNPSMSLIINSNDKIYSELTNNEISLVYIDASDDLSKGICKTSMKLIASGDAHASTYKFTLTPRLVEDESLKSSLFYGSREEKQNTFKSILATLIKELDQEFSEENIVPINFHDQFQTLDLEVILVKKDGQLATFPTEKVKTAMKKEKFIKAEITPVFKYLQLDPTMFDNEFSQRLNELDSKKIFSSFSGL